MTDKLKSPQQIATQFLQRNGFFSYLNHSSFQVKADQSIKQIFKSDYPYCLELKTTNKKVQKNNQLQYCLELGGTYLYCYAFKQKNNKIEIIKQFTTSFYSKKTYTPEIFFSELTKQLIKLSVSSDLSNISELTLVLAFPIQPIITKTHLLDGKLLAFGKNHQQNKLINSEIGKNWSKYLLKNHQLAIKINILNDSNSSLLAGISKQSSPQPIINLIVGTGTNISLALPNSRSLKLYNLEFGKYDLFPYSNFDLQLQQETSQTTNYNTEKLFAGAWQNHLFRIMHQQLITDQIIDKKNFPIKLYAKSSAFQLETYFTHQSTNPSFQILKICWQAISLRGAYLSAFTTSRLIIQLQKKSPPNRSDFRKSRGQLKKNLWQRCYHTD